VDYAVLSPIGQKELTMTLDDIYSDILAARRKLDAYDLMKADHPFTFRIRGYINKALADLDSRAAIELAFSNGSETTYLSALDFVDAEKN
jgi:hypothetical protein